MTLTDIEAVTGTVKWIEQQDAQGCGLAVLAMICGHSYERVRETVDAWGESQHDWSRDGATHYTLDRYLAGDGWFIQRRYATWTELPMEPFASIHYASVMQPSKHQHFVCVLGDGTVLDPYRRGAFSLSDWPQVNQLVGVCRGPR